jgi:hypothetical protein
MTSSLHYDCVVHYPYNLPLPKHMAPAITYTALDLSP